MGPHPDHDETAGAPAPTDAPSAPLTTATDGPPGDNTPESGPDLGSGGPTTDDLAEADGAPDAAWPESDDETLAANDETAAGYDEGAVADDETAAADDATAEPYGEGAVSYDEAEAEPDAASGPEWTDDLEAAPATAAPAPSGARPRRPRPAARRPGPPRRRPPPAGRRSRPDDAPAPAAAKAANQRGVVIVLTLVSLLVVGLGVGGVVLGRKGTRSATPVTTPPTTGQPVVTLPADAFLTYKDLEPEFAFTMRYPRGWTRSEAPVREVRLIASDGKQFSTLVRVIHTEQATTPANLANIKTFAEGSLDPNIKVLKQDTVNVNGMIGFRYIYTYTDATSGLTGAHIHYFLFQGHKMNSIIFESANGDFNRMEGVFDQMLDSFRSEPE